MNSSTRTIGRLLLVVFLSCACVGSALAATTSGAPGPSELLPKFSPDGGLFAGRVSLKMTAPTADTIIRYTVDGSEPNASSPIASNAVSIVRTALVRARVFRQGRFAGPTLAQSYLLASADVARFSGNLPVVVIQLFGQEVQHETKQMASIQVLDLKDGKATLEESKSALTDIRGLDLRGEVWWRGKSSLRYAKRSLGVKLRDDAGKSQARALLGMPADSDWVLYAPYPDKTLIRDVLAYELSNQMGRYASRTRFVEVFLNERVGRLTMDHYMGVYVLEEKIKRAPERVNIQKLGTNDNAEPLISGGYVFKKDHGATVGEVEPSMDGRPNFGVGNSGSRYGYPTGPGGFPADPRGFLPPVGGERAGNRRRGVMTLPPGAGQGPIETPFERVQREIVIQDGRPVIVDRKFGPGGRNGEMRRSFTPGRGWGPVGVEESFSTDQGNEYYYVEPKEDEISVAQKRWLRNHLNEFERVLYGPGFADPKKGYAAYIDPDSFIDYHLIVEVTKNIDGFRFSTYFQKDRGGRIKAEPIWDWNLSFGNANGKQGWMSEHWYWPQLDDEQYSYYRRLFEDPEFGQRYVDRWGELRSGVLSDSNLMARIDGHIATLGEARIRNFARWPILGRMVWPNYFVGQTYEEEISNLKDWTRKRLAWIQAQFTAAPRIALAKSAGGKTAQMTVPHGEVYYTLDGSDPRAPGGKPSSRALKYQNPVPLKGGTKLTARAVFEDRWSPPSRSSN